MGIQYKCDKCGFIESNIELSSFRRVEAQVINNQMDEPMIRNALLCDPCKHDWFKMNTKWLGGKR